MVSFIISLCLFGCGHKSENIGETVLETTVTEAEKETIYHTTTEESVYEPVYRFGQDINNYIGTVKEVFGLYGNENYINLLDCNFKDFAWFLKDVDIELSTTYLRKKVQGHDYLMLDLFDEVGGKYIGMITLINTQSEAVMAKDCYIDTLLLTPSSLKGIKVLDGGTDLGELESETIKNYMYNLGLTGENGDEVLGDIELFPSVRYTVDDIGSVRFDIIDGELQPGWSIKHR